METCTFAASQQMKACQEGRKIYILFQAEMTNEMGIELRCKYISPGEKELAHSFPLTKPLEILSIKRCIFLCFEEREGEV